MAEFILAKIMLHKDGSVHICLNDCRTFYGTASNLMCFLEKPSSFIKKEVDQERESTDFINPGKISLEKIPGVCLAQYTSGGRITCNFSELFMFVFAASQNEDERSRPLNMYSFILEQNLSDPKSFLLKYYLDFVNTFDANTVIKNKLEIEEDILFSTLREIINSVFTIEPVKPKKKNLDNRVADVKYSQLFNSSAGEENEKISLSEYAAKHNETYDVVFNLANTGQLKTAVRNERMIFEVNRNEPLPIKTKKKQEKRIQAVEDDIAYLVDSNDWSAKNVEEYCVARKLFSSRVAKYIFTKQELNYYVKAGMLEIEWNNRRCLIADVEPNLVTEDGVSNRDRMLKGESPMAYFEGAYHSWEIHHLGQCDSVFVTLPYHIHHGPGYSKMFHYSAPSKDLHGPEFDAEKRLFWKHYIKLYDEDGRGEFKRIPHIFPTKSTKPIV